MDPKTELNQFCQQICARPVTKSDIVYVTSKFGHQFGHQFQAIVTLNCLQGQEFAGYLSPTPKEAEKSAAQQALTTYTAQEAVLPTPTPAPKAAAGGGSSDKEAKSTEESDNPAITPKTKLNSLCMRIAKRFLQKGETVYESCKVVGGYQATVRLAALPGEWKDRTWAGEVFTTKQKAEQSAAVFALKQISADPELSEEAARPKGNNRGRGSGGKGEGSKGKDSSSSSGGGGKGAGWGWTQGWTWQSGSSGPDLPRDRIMEERITGQVLEWRDTYGWLKSDQTIDHPAAQRRGGKIYVHRRDIPGEGSSLEPNTAVSFYVYADPSGLGAEDLTLE
mmetsp:Transcript_53036/g.119500  ORF Transcript_53036/g.119500 Transcript_53036/m.119500 type:complete len:335 (-) Transcript_53036:77-1081(-)